MFNIVFIAIEAVFLIKNITFASRIHFNPKITEKFCITFGEAKNHNDT